MDIFGGNRDEKAGTPKETNRVAELNKLDDRPENISCDESPDRGAGKQEDKGSVSELSIFDEKVYYGARRPEGRHCVAVQGYLDKNLHDGTGKPWIIDLPRVQSQEARELDDRNCSAEPSNINENPNRWTLRLRNRNCIVESSKIDKTLDQGHEKLDFVAESSNSDENPNKDEMKNLVAEPSNFNENSGDWAGRPKNETCVDVESRNCDENTDESAWKQEDRNLVAGPCNSEENLDNGVGRPEYRNCDAEPSNVNENSDNLAWRPDNTNCVLESNNLNANHNEEALRQEDKNCVSRPRNPDDENIEDGVGRPMDKNCVAEPRYFDEDPDDWAWRPGNSILQADRSQANSTIDIIDHRFIAAAATSVGIVIYDTVLATGFRVGSKYIMVPWHVVLDICKLAMTPVHLEDCVLFAPLGDTRIDFNYEKRGHHEAKSYKFKPVVQFVMDGFADICVLELEGNDFPPPFTNFGKVNYHKECYLIGHSGGEVKASDRISYRQTLPQDCEEWSRSKTGNSNDDGFEGLRDDNCVEFSAKFGKGASGSPGVSRDANVNPFVVLMFLRGYPHWYYDKTVSKPELSEAEEKDYLIKQGVKIQAVSDCMQIKDPVLWKDIFST